MNYKELYENMKEQYEALTKSVDALNTSIDTITKGFNVIIDDLTISFNSTIASLNKEIEELKALLSQEGIEKEKLASQLNGLAKIALPKKSEKQIVTISNEQKKLSPTPKERGNNGAKRKVLDIEEEIVNVEPDSELFISDKAHFISHRDVIRYVFIPSKLIRRIYRCKRYTIDGSIYEGKAPDTPLFNSQYDASFIGYILQLRYVYGMPVERIMRLLQENHIDIPKSTLHGIVKRSAALLDIMDDALKRAILESNYIHFDETYHTILDNSVERGSRKGYFWAALSHSSRLMHFVYKEGSRSTKVFEEYMSTDYVGVIQTDGYTSYKIVDNMSYAGVVRLGCVQHCKRYFEDIKEQPEAKKIIGLYNKFYQIRKKNEKSDWVELSIKVYDELDEYLRTIDKDPKYIANSILRKGVTYCINELYSIYNIIISTEYDLDNNAIERPMRYISISRRNSMFCGSDNGAERSALIYSLAVSCRLNGVNTLEYFSDIILKISKLPPKASYDKLRMLLPDKWKVNR